MKHHFGHQEDFFDNAGATIYANFAPWMAGRAGNPSGMLPIAITANQGTAPTAGSSLAGSTVSVTTGGITINLLFDAAAMAAPANFRDGIVQAATILAGTISDKITVNLVIDYSGTGGGAPPGPDHRFFQPPLLIRSHPINNAAPRGTHFYLFAGGK